MARFLLKLAVLKLFCPERHGAVMKFVVPMKSTHDSKSKNVPKSNKHASLKHGAADIAQRYQELVRLRGQVYQLEQKSRFAAESRKSELIRFDQAGIA
jgi:hypothetical protein